MDTPSEPDDATQPTPAGRPKKARRFAYGAVAAVGILAGAAGIASAATGQESPEPTYQSSVTLTEKPGAPEQSDAAEAAQLQSLAKITEAEAHKAATSAVAGEVIESELDDEDGNVVYEVEVKAADGKVTEVIIDAGNGKVLHQEVDHDDEGHDDNCRDSGTSTIPTTSAG